MNALSLHRNRQYYQLGHQLRFLKIKKLYQYQSTTQKMFFVRGYAIMGITTAMGILCLQDSTKKGMVFRNFAKQMWGSKDATTSVESGKETKITGSIKQKYDTAIQTAQQIKQKGQGSYYAGLKKMYTQSKQHQPVQKTPVKQIISEKLHNIKQKASATAQKIKQEGIKQSVSKKIDGAKTAITGTYTGAVSGYHKTIDTYNKASELKSQKLIKKHLTFGGMALFGSLFMPKTYFMLTAAYFAAYQLYYFAEQVNQSKASSYFQPMKFTPIWTGFMIGGGALLGGKIFKTAKTFI